MNVYKKGHGCMQCAQTMGWSGYTKFHQRYYCSYCEITLYVDDFSTEKFWFDADGKPLNGKLDERVWLIGQYLEWQRRPLFWERGIKQDSVVSKLFVEHAIIESVRKFLKERSDMAWTAKEIAWELKMSRMEVGIAVTQLITDEGVVVSKFIEGRYRYIYEGKKEVVKNEQQQT